jgi:hypothetical protein
MGATGLVCCASSVCALQPVRSQGRFDAAPELGRIGCRAAAVPEPAWRRHQRVISKYPEVVPRVQLDLVTQCSKDISHLTVAAPLELNCHSSSLTRSFVAGL